MNTDNVDKTSNSLRKEFEELLAVNASQYEKLVPGDNAVAQTLFLGIIVKFGAFFIDCFLRHLSLAEKQNELLEEMFKQRNE